MLNKINQLNQSNTILYKQNYNIRNKLIEQATKPYQYLTTEQLIINNEIKIKREKKLLINEQQVRKNLLEIIFLYQEIKKQKQLKMAF